MIALKRPDIEETVMIQMETHNGFDRDSSFDYCYNYFLLNKNFVNEMEKSCLIIGFYLSSWGMLRGSSFLLKKSAKHYQKIVEFISNLDKEYWQIDVNSYNDGNIEKIIDLSNEIKERVVEPKHRDIVIITKLLLGIFGITPAFDKYFANNFKKIFAHKNIKFNKLTKDALFCIHDFYKSNQVQIDNLSNKTFTFNFITGKASKINYTKARIIDIYGVNSKQ